jgi:hypothetical protein
MLSKVGKLEVILLSHEVSWKLKVPDEDHGAQPKLAGLLLYFCVTEGQAVQLG